MISFFENPMPREYLVFSYHSVYILTINQVGLDNLGGVDIQSCDKWKNSDKSTGILVKTLLLILTNTEHTTLRVVL